MTKTNNSDANSIDGKWVLNKFHKGNSRIDKSKQSLIPTLEVQVGEKKVAGSDGCNTIFGTLSTLNDQEIKIGILGGTKMGCKMKTPYDQVYRNLLSTARTYKIKDSTLILFDGADSKLLEFERIRE